MNDLSEVTAVCVDTLNHELAIDACWKMAQHRFAQVVLFTDGAAEPYLPKAERGAFRVERIPTLTGRGAYSDFVLHKLAEHITTTHALVFQWDGFVLNADRWNPAFLDYDYIGALFPWGHETGRRVGNGGFSLRSARLMRTVAAMVPHTSESEDGVICELYAARLESEHGMQFAPAELAMHFSIDQMALPPYRQREPHLVADRTFGFHGFFNLHLAFGDFELLDLIDRRLGASRNTLLTTRPAATLLLALLAANRQSVAGEIASRCASLLGMNRETVSVREVMERCWQENPR